MVAGSIPVRGAKTTTIYKVNTMNQSSLSL
jgi:hypothetical protein